MLWGDFKLLNHSPESCECRSFIVEISQKSVLSVSTPNSLIPRPPGIRPKRDRWTGEDNGMEKVAGTAGEVTPGATNGASWMQTEGAQLVGL